MSDFEKLGKFYLGRPYDLEKKSAKPGLLLYDSKDLVTHAVCVGRTGSGKTGLCIGLLEEAAIDNVPAIIIDPKGDIANLLLTFPNLHGGDFLPWINSGDAKKKGLTPEAFADKEAAKWKAGLESWGQEEPESPGSVRPQTFSCIPPEARLGSLFLSSNPFPSLQEKYWKTRNC